MFAMTSESDMTKIGIRNFVSMEKIENAMAKHDGVPLPAGIMIKYRDNQQR
jgi:hypothetical protein